jgi:multidrug efflux pump subunit AcrB
MRERGLDMLSVRAALAGANASAPSGFVMNPDSASGQRIGIETGYFFESAKDVADVVVGVHAGKPIYLKEVAQIEEGAQQAQQYVSYMPGSGSVSAPFAADNNAELSGQMYPAVTLTVTKKPGENAVDVSRAVRARVDQLRNTVLPQGIEATITRDYGETAAEKANKLIQN